MKKELLEKYRPVPVVDLKERSWASKVIDKAPVWCSVDLRDGNQALVDPMNLEQKLEFYQLLLALGFKEIEIGFPAAADVEFQFLRTLIEKRLIPNDVVPQVLTQSRAHLIDLTFEALAGAKKAIVHLYNSTSTLQRRVVFGMDRGEILEIAVRGTKQIKKLAADTDTSITLEYSPESFTGTELNFALEVCNAVIDEWQPTPENPIIINLPATVEVSTPNVYADQIEWMNQRLKPRDSIVLSVHTHNDRGTAVAATELALMAGAQRVEGTLFGNGERTGNVDIVTLALNLYTQGVDPELELHDINKLISVSERLTNIPVHIRHPYAGGLVFTAFSGSHQDAINKGLAARRKASEKLWEVPYLPIDPSDLGRSYEAIIRINSQSGKGGVAYIMEQDFGCALPKAMHAEFSSVVQGFSDRVGREILSKEIWELFSKEYLEMNSPLNLISYNSRTFEDQQGESIDMSLTIDFSGKKMELQATGNGPIDAVRKALIPLNLSEFTLTEYSQHALEQGSESRAIAYVQITDAEGRKVWGVGMSSSITRAGIGAFFSAINRLIA